MEQRPFGPTQRNVSVVGQGTWYIERADKARVLAALRRGLDLGMNHIDTAEMYGSGASEEIIGEALEGRRAEAFLVSKVLPHNASAKGTVAACEASLKRLKTDRLDCYLLHWRGEHPLAETVRGMDALQRDGKIISWGVSNFDENDLAELLKATGKPSFACNQVLYHLKERAIEHAVLPWCEKHGVAVTAYSPFGHNDFPGPSTRGGQVLQEVALAHNATVHQVALRFLLRSPALFAIPKASQAEHTGDNAGAGDLQLTPAEIARIDEAFPRGKKPRSLPMI